MDDSIASSELKSDSTSRSDYLANSKTSPPPTDYSTTQFFIEDRAEIWKRIKKLELTLKPQAAFFQSGEKLNHALYCSVFITLFALIGVQLVLTYFIYLYIKDTPGYSANMGTFFFLLSLLSLGELTGVPLYIKYVLSNKINQLEDRISELENN